MNNQKQNRLIILAYVIFIFSGCRTTNPQYVQRETKKFTVSVPLTPPYNLPAHYEYRPTKEVTVGAGYWTRKSSSGEFGDEVSGNPLLWRETHSELYLQYYPVDQSGFYLGVGGEQVNGTFSVESGSRSYPDLAVGTKLYSGKYDAAYGGPIFGWTWIWNTGFTLGFDLSTRKRYRSTFEYDYQRMEATTDVKAGISEVVTPDVRMGTIILGFSF